MTALKNTRHEAFAQELAKGTPATTAYALVGFKPNDGNAGRLNRNELVQSRVSELVEAGAKKAQIDVDRVVAELVKIATTDVADVADWGTKEVGIGYDDDGKQLRPEDIGDAVLVRYVDAPFLTLRNLADLTPAARAAVSEVALTKDGFKVKMHDKVGALGLLARHLRMFAEDGAPLAIFNIALVDSPPRETRDQWLERTRRERDALTAGDDHQDA